MKVVDLTVPLYDGLQSYVAHPKVTIYDYVTHSFSAPRYKPPAKGFATKLMIISDHMGTHLDAPFHFVEGGKTIDEVSVTDTFGEAVLIDVSDKPEDQAVTVEMLEEKLQATNETIKEGDIVFIRTWPHEWNAPGFHHYEVLDEAAAHWLADKKVKSVGVDAPNIDTGVDMRRPCHMALLPKGIGIMENVANLDQLSKTRFFFMGLPLLVKGLSGSPIRAVAIEEW